MSETPWPKISIVIPNFNGGDTLAQTLQSILDQNYPALEILVADGASTDNSVQVIRQFEKHIAWWTSEKDAGHYDAVNKGFAHATGDILAWINSDDIYLPHALLTVGDIFRALPQVNWLTTLTPAHMDCLGHSLGTSPVIGYSKLSFLDGRHLAGASGLLISYIQQESTFWRRSLWEKTGACIRPEYTLAGDLDLWTRFFDHSEVAVVQSLLGSFRNRAGQRSQKQLQLYLEQARLGLADMRRRNAWSPNVLREIAYRLRVRYWPVLGPLLVKSLGYRALQVVRLNPDTPAGTWSITPRPYL